jgi:hypothetical protein
VRHNFVNDIGDYAKYALLRALCGSDPKLIRLGVIWYLTEHAESNGDGRKRAHLSQEGWERLDPGLLTMMQQIERALPSQGPNLGLIEAAGILPAGTAFFSEAIPGIQRTPRQRAFERAGWFERAQRSVAGCNLIFLDPDNGLEVPSAPVTSRIASKYATVAEVATLLENGAGVVLYQHGSRIPWEAQRERVCAQISSGTDQALVMRTVRFGAFGVRAFFCVTARPRMTEAVERGLERLCREVAGWDKARYLLVE